jgi:hypothetical protein
MVTQLRDVLSAEQSAEMAEEHEHNRLVAPQIAELVRGTVGIGE